MVRKAFTIIELLVVVAIIAILAAILFPVFARAKMAGHKTADLTHIRQISVAALVYSSDYDDHFLSFPFIDIWGNPQNSARMGGLFWSDRLMPYINSDDIFSSNLNKEIIWYPEGYWVPGATSATTTAGESGTYKVTYTLNHMLTRGEKAPETAGAVALTSVDQQADVAMIGPGQWAWNWSTCVADENDPLVRHFAWNISESGMGWGYELFGNKDHKGGFDGGANFAYLDTHAKFARAIPKGTDAGDLYSYHGSDLYKGQFVGVKTRLRVGTDGTCPADRGSITY